MTNSVLASLGDVTLMRVNFINLLISMYCHVASFTCICWTYRRPRAALPSLELILSIIPVQHRNAMVSAIYTIIVRERYMQLSILFAEFEHASSKPVNRPI